MKTLLPITVTIITKNEEKRIEAAIRSVQSFASQIVVVDSGSSDATVEIAKKCCAEVVVEAFRGFGQQKNLAASLAKQTWILNIDADEVVNEVLETELREHFQSSEINSVCGFYLPRKTWYLNRWVMHGGWYPNYLLRLARKDQSKWTEPALHEALTVKGKTAYFQSPLEHFSFPSQKSHVLKNVEYAEHAKQNLIARGKKASVIDFTLKPIWKFIDGYFLKRGFLDGAAGFFIAIHSAYAVFLRYTYLYEQSTKNTHS